MYNRYIPQSDGSYRRHPIPDRNRPRPGPEPVHCSPPEPENCPPPEPPPCPQPRHWGPEEAGGFLKKLLPAGLDTEDLLILVLLLLMSGDCREDRNLPLLTLALYLFL